MKNISVLTLCTLMLMSLFTIDSFAQEERKVKGMRYFHLNVFYPRQLPLEIGLGYQRTLDDDYYFSFGYKYVNAVAKTAPTDLHRFNKLRMNTNESMHTFQFRLGRSIHLFNKLKWNIELGPSYNIYRHLEFRPITGNRYGLYEFTLYKDSMLGLSIKNSINVSDLERWRFDTFWHNNINGQFTYSALGLQIGYKTFKK